MRLRLAASLLLISALPHLGVTRADAQNDGSGWQARPKMNAAMEFLPQTRVQTWGELQNGIDISFQRWRAGGMLNRRLKPLVNSPTWELDVENQHHLVFGTGYEYLHTVQHGRRTNENRAIVEVTPRLLFSSLLLADRNRTEFRWKNGVYDFRYRNRLTIGHYFETATFRFMPYASGEIYYDRNADSWDQSKYGLGVQFPYKHFLKFDTYLLHQNCTGCGANPVNMLGITLNFYLMKTQ